MSGLLSYVRVRHFTDEENRWWMEVQGKRCVHHRMRRGTISVTYKPFYFRFPTDNLAFYEKEFRKNIQRDMTSAR